MPDGIEMNERPRRAMLDIKYKQTEGQLSGLVRIVRRMIRKYSNPDEGQAMTTLFRKSTPDLIGGVEKKLIRLEASDEIQHEDLFSSLQVNRHFVHVSSSSRLPVECRASVSLVWIGMIVVVSLSCRCRVVYVRRFNSGVWTQIIQGTLGRGQLG